MDKSNKNILKRDFLVPPFSVFDTRTGVWQARKQEWRRWLGNTNESRDGVLYDNLEFRLPELYTTTKEDRERLGVSFEEYVAKYVPEDKLTELRKKALYNGASSFDPVVAELVFRWFAPCKGANVFDCFAGGITKGAVANKCDLNFTGIEIRQKQVEDNRKRCEELGLSAKYIQGDARGVINHLGYATQDLLLTCPPYYDLEVYSNDENDASNQRSYEDFYYFIESAFSYAIECLKANRFAVVVVGDIRDNNGGYRDFPGDVIRLFQEYGCQLWNDIVLVGNDINAKVRARRYMNRRKVVRTHQRVLVFYKGKVGNLPKIFGDILPEPEI